MFRRRLKKKIRLKVREKGLATMLEFPRGERRLQQSTGLARGILPLIRRCGSRHKPFIKPSRRVSLRLHGCAPPTHPFSDLFILLFFFPPPAEQWNFAFVNAKQEQADALRRLPRHSAAEGCRRARSDKGHYLLA